LADFSERRALSKKHGTCCAWLDQLNLAKVQFQPKLKALADITQKIVLKEAFDQQANKRLK
jgi:hypothetical protein